MIRVLVVDDSPTMRQLLAQILGADRDIEVVGVADNGRAGVRMAQTLKPDIVTMDIEMPLMNGFEATREIMANNPRPIVIVSTSTLVADAQNAMRALQAGALTLVSKPVGPDAPGFDRAAQRLVEMVKIMADVNVIKRGGVGAEPDSSEEKRALPRRAPRHVDVVAMLASTGGPPVLRTILAGLPEQFAAPIMIVQHLAVGFMEGFVSWLDGSVSLKVKTAAPGERMVPGTVYVGPEDRHLGVTRSGNVLISDQPALDGFRPSGSYLYQSAASVYGAGAVAVILTGMGSDGVTGLAAIRDAGGWVLAQDADSCVVNGMPGSAVEAGLADEVMTPEDITRQLLQFAPVMG